MIDLNHLLLSVKVGIYSEDGKTRAKFNEHPVVFSNNTLHTLFCHPELCLNGQLISHSNNCYLHSAFIDTELTTDTEKKPGSNFRDILIWNKQKSTIKRSINFTPTLIAKKCTAELYGALHIDFLECEKFLIPGVILHLRLFRSLNNTLLFLKGTDDEAKVLDGKVQSVIEKASLFVRKLVVTDSVKLSFEKALLKSCAIYPYIESLSKSFFIQAGQNCSNKEYVFGTEPMRRLTLRMVKNSLFRSTPLNHSPFGVQRVEIQRGNGVPLAGTSLDTSNNIRLYYSTIKALGFTKSGNGIRLEVFEDNNFILVFDLTSTKEASENLTLFRELTGSSLTLKLYFSEALGDAIEFFLISERLSQVFIDSARNISKNTLIDG